MFDSLDVPPQEPFPTPARNYLPWMLAACFIYEYLLLFHLPWTPRLDQGNSMVYQLGGMRLLAGRMIYRDFFDFVAPGTDVVYFVLYRIFGIRAWIPNATTIALSLGLTLLSVVISRKVMSGPAVYLPGLVFLGFTYFWHSDPTHHWYSSLAVVAALAVLMEARTLGRLTAAGALCGVATFFTQTRGVLALLGVAGFLAWEVRRKQLGRGWLFKCEIQLVSGFLVTVAALYAYFIYSAGLGRILDCTVVFLFRYSTAYPPNTWAPFLAGWPVFHGWHRQVLIFPWMLVCLFQPFAYILFVWRWARESGRDGPLPWERWMLVCMVGATVLLGDVRAPSAVRLSADCLPALILIAGLLESPGWVPRASRAALFITACAFMLLTPFFRRRIVTRELDLPAGRVFLWDRDLAEELQWLLPRVTPGEFLLAQGQVFNVYLHLPDPANVPFFTTTDFTRPEQVQATVEGVEKHRVRWVVWNSSLDLANAHPPESDHLGALYACLREHYQLVRNSPAGYQVWERNLGP